MDSKNQLNKPRYDSSTIYQKPGKIFNDFLLDRTAKGNQQKLRENLVEHFDFEAVSAAIWLHFYSWYSADCQVVRYMKKDKLNSKSFILELYPEMKYKNLSFMGHHESSESEDNDNNHEDSFQIKHKDTHYIKTQTN